MPNAIASRLFTILAITYLAVSTIFPSVPGSLFWFFDPKQDVSFAPALKKGLDMGGGVSLMYEIKVPEGGGSPKLAEEVATALKQRVDPQGIRNLIWRPSGATRLEIQMPLTDTSDKIKALRDDFLAAKNTLADTNITPAQVTSALSDADPVNRQKRVEALAQGSTQRAKLLTDLLANQARSAAADVNDAVTRGQARLERERLLLQVGNLNVNVDTVVDATNIQDATARTKRLDQLKAQTGEFPARISAIDNLAKTGLAFSPFKSNVDSVTELKNLLRGSGVLSFHIVARLGDATEQQFIEFRDRLARDGPRVRSGDPLRWFLIPKDRVKDIAGDGMGIGRPDVSVYNGEHYLLVWNTPEKSMINRPGVQPWGLKQAYETRGGTAGSERVVGFEFDAVGAQRFGELTGRHVPRGPDFLFQLAPVLDGQVISAPNIQSQIGSTGIISGGRGGFSPVELSYLIKTLAAGSLPAQLKDEPMVERVVGPQLGADNLRRGLQACVFGVVVVAIFLIGYYYLSGVVAMIAVSLNLLLILAGMAAFNATFTLPGVAGIILTIGMAVDANVLIFERLREEQLKGLSLRLALRNAYDRAFSAIFDANITTAITAGVLYLIGTEEIRGFGLTLMLGLVSSMFTALYVTRTIFALLIEKFGVEKLGSLPLTFPRWDRFLKPNIDWMGKVWIFIGFSTVFTAIGLSLFIWKFSQGKVLDIEFAGGTTVQLELKQPANLTEVRALVEGVATKSPDALPAWNVQSVGDDNRTYEVVTVNSKAIEVRRAVEEAFAGKLNVAEPIRFAGVSDSYEKAVADLRIIPIENDAQTIAGIAPTNIAQHVGGVAVILKDLSSTSVTDRQIEERLEQQRQQMGGAFKNIDVEKLDDGGFLVMVSSDDIKYDAANTADWETNVARPTWEKAVTGLNQPAQLQRVNTIDPSIAGDTRIDAILASIIAVVVIVAYIWARFGDFKFGSATIVATLHDTLIVLAALGFAHVIAETFIGELLYIDAFRLNLTVIAAILTVIGYSMNDTVVVFDRVRENRGKLGHVDRQIINDSINQTLSRTLLTGGTTFATVVFMYIMGGEAIHGFTYVLMIGILVGTYSSIAIASPLLMFGSKGLDKQLSEANKPTSQTTITASVQ